MVKPAAARRPAAATAAAATATAAAAAAAAAAPPAGMVSIPAASNFTFVSGGVEIECDDDHGVDFQFPWEPTPRRNHAQPMGIDSFYIDKYPVTNGQYASYLARTHYAPRDATSHVKHWPTAAGPAAADAHKPVRFLMCGLLGPPARVRHSKKHSR